jgi:hypothetical protein
MRECTRFPINGLNEVLLIVHAHQELPNVPSQHAQNNLWILDLHNRPSSVESGAFAPWA